MPVYVPDPDATPEIITLYRTRIVTETVEVPVHHYDTEFIYIRCIVDHITATLTVGEQQAVQESGFVMCPS